MINYFFKLINGPFAPFFGLIAFPLIIFSIFKYLIYLPIKSFIIRIGGSE